jgi:LacI family transcriptional regulator
MKAATTLLEISKLLKLSPSTVSRALKNHPDISPATRDKVLELAQKLDYEPNLNAVGLRTSNSKEIAVIVPSLSGFFYDSFISAIEDEGRKFGYSTIILLSGDDPQVESENLKICKQRRVQGVFACLTSNTTSLEPFSRLKKVEISIIFFDKVPSSGDEITVRVGDEEAALLAATRLIEKGKKRILALFADPKMSITQRRIRALRTVFENRSRSEDFMVEYATSPKAAEHFMMKAYGADNKPDAVFCMSDEILIGVMKAVQRLKINYPEDLGIIAISNGFFPKLYSPEITFVETSGYRLGKLAFSRMLEEFDGKGLVNDLALKAELFPGESL